MSKLNEAQKKAVQTIKGRLLILAGAGSGKTSVLIARIVHLLEDHNIPPSSILGLTFTNKAAEEMRQRISRIVSPSVAKEITLSTFHSFCMQILRKEINHLGYTKDFSLYGEREIKRLLTQMARHTLKHDGELPSLEPTFLKISQARMLGESIEVEKHNPWHEHFAKELHERLEKALRAYNAVDFDGLLSLSLQLFQQFPSVLEAYQQRFLHIMIDEYQDTNPLQYKLASLLSAKHGNLCVVGDDDQSIYGWRGAKIEHILQFRADTIVKLEQNYRSTPLILKAANAVIRNNTKRHEKELWSEEQEGERPELFHAPTETDEAAAVVQRLLHLRETKNLKWGQIAILYRSNALSRHFELALLQATWRKEGSWIRGIPYKIYGGLELFERSEIKDLLAYLKTISNPLDEEALLRIINIPRRGISDQTLSKLTEYNRTRNIPLWALLQNIPEELDLPDKACKNIDNFVSLISRYAQAFLSQPLHSTLKAFVEEVGYRKAIEEEVKSDKMRTFKWESVEEFIEGLKIYEQETALQTQTKGSLVDFLATTMLDEKSWQLHHSEQNEDKVNLMTFHSAKGLEFEACFLVALEELIIPHEKAVSCGGLEEERRLMYVAITRAKTHLCMSMARERKHMGKEKASTPSRFLFEIPKEVLKITSWKHVP